MPELSRFLGIVITMYYNDHAPPHFHAKYAGHDVTVHIADGKVEGFFPKRAMNLVLEWYNLHKDELAENWARSRARKSLRPIEPLE